MLHQIYPFVSHDYDFELNKEFTFAAAHYIPNDKAGKCSRVHGHNYTVNICIAGDVLDDTGFLVNFTLIKKLVHDRFDHTLLNDDESFNNDDSNYFPSTEVVAKTIWNVVQDFLNRLTNKPKCLQIFLRETQSSYVVYRPKMEKQI